MTGAAGFIGSHVSRVLAARGDHVVGIDNFDPFYDVSLKRANVASIGEGFELREVDIRDEAAMLDLFRGVRPSGVIHLAARAGVRPSIKDPVGYAEVNVGGTAVVLACAERSGCERVVAASSSSVYGNNRKTPFSEEDSVEHPISPYAATKRSCELIGETHQLLTGMPTAMLRFFTVFGPRQRPDLAISKFLGMVSKGEAIPLFGDGTTSRDYTFIDDIVAGVLSAHEQIDGFGYRIWNLGGDSPVTLSEMVATVGRVVGREPVIDRRAMQPGDVERTWSDLTRSRGELGYSPTTSFEAGMALQWAAAQGV